MGNIKRKAKTCRFYLVKPQERKNAHSLAERIANMKDVEEVMLTEGEYGYLVRVREKSPAISKLLESSDSLYCHCTYKAL